MGVKRKSTRNLEINRKSTSPCLFDLWAPVVCKERARERVSERGESHLETTPMTLKARALRKNPAWLALFFSIL